ncbi:hypothetical protein [Stenotrophomonas ginsengisoli]|uniref:hypothetical protein n=1 Tax=Stenotrophomonas ginsengisoli TaxID=336566 RepID=UPI0013A07E36|nr:hypothetical protein [Stenotrophomonas ginsengisoli]
MEGPENKFNNSDTLLLAQPISTTREPLPDGSGLWPRDYRQHVVWEVVKVWKGSTKVGDQFEQTRWIRRVAGHCSGQEELGSKCIFPACRSGTVGQSPSTDDGQRAHGILEQDHEV